VLIAVADAHVRLELAAAVLAVDRRPRGRVS